MSNDVFVDARGLVYLLDRNRGLDDSRVFRPAGRAAGLSRAGHGQRLPARAYFRITTVGLALVALHQIAVVHPGGAVDEVPREMRVAHAPRLVLRREQDLPGIDVHHVLEPVLMLVRLLGDQAELLQLGVRAGEIGERDLDVMSPELALVAAGLAIDDALLGAGLYPRIGPVSSSASPACVSTTSW